MDLINDPFSYQGKSLILENQSVVKCKGSDVVRFFNGQLTNDTALLKSNQFQGQVRLDRNGKVQFFFYLLNCKDSYYIIINNSEKKELLADLDKYIIMDDVEFEETSKIAHIKFHHEGKSYFASLPCDMTFENDNTFEVLAAEEILTLSLMGGEPVWGKTIIKDQLVTDSIAMLECVSLQKGCFLGQETVAKIESRRGGAFFPVALKKYDEMSVSDFLVDGKTIAKLIENLIDFEVVFLKREFRVQGKMITLDSGEKRSVQYLPLWKKQNQEERAVSLYEKGIELFQKNDEESAISHLRQAIQIKPDFADAYESLGVIYGRHEKYDEAIRLMDQLAKVDEDSVMAYTNKSLYLMKQGKIEEAEEAKAEATVKTFAMYGKQAQDKREIEEQKKQEVAELERREGMFRQVLELDPDDALAGYGLADIEYYRENYDTSIELLDKVILSNPKYSVAYLLLSRCLVKKKSTRAKEILIKGIDVASKNGDLMPANSMQEILNKL